MLFCTTVWATEPRVPVLVELFTSEGCSSCPPADELLRKLGEQPVAGVEVIALSEHVDYWNRLGWRDPFSAVQFSERQQRYAVQFGINGPYTPQMVVDGRVEFVGSDSRRLAGALRDAAERAKSPVEITVEGTKLRASAPEGRGEMWLAITEDGLETDVSRGENSGRKLRHDAVVRKLVRMGRAPSATMELGLDASWRREHLSAIVFLQDPGTRAVTGVARRRLE
ncbi:MAG: DUF1223 domain-containing protein [Bryobacteraceae bacterium]